MLCTVAQRSSITLATAPRQVCRPSRAPITIPASDRKFGFVSALSWKLVWLKIGANSADPALGSIALPSRATRSSCSGRRSSRRPLAMHNAMSMLDHRDGVACTLTDSSGKNIRVCAARCWNTWQKLRRCWRLALNSAQPSSSPGMCVIHCQSSDSMPHSISWWHLQHLGTHINAPATAAKPAVGNSTSMSWCPSAKAACVASRASRISWT